MTHCAGRLLLAGVTMAAGGVSSAGPVAAQELRLTGTVEARAGLGHLRGDLCLHGVPDADTLTFTLNRGLEVGTVRAGADGPVLAHEGFYDGEWLGEGVLYDVAVPDSLRPLPGLCVEYAGAVPVFDGNPATEDWKGRIVANRGTLRATEQAKWYPILYDRASETQETMVAYDLAVECGDCASLYVNGSKPAPGPRARFTSAASHPLLLFVGDFAVREAGGLTFAGGSVEERDAALFRRDVDAIASAYEEFVGVPYEGSPVFLTFLSIASRRTPGRSTWAFVTWPTVAFDGAIDFGSVVETGDDGVRGLPAWLRRTLSHELAHYYFGTVLRPTGPLRWFYVESLAEYLSLWRMQRVESPEVFQARVKQLRDGALAAGDVVPLSRITRYAQIGESYRYQLAPLWLLSLQQRAGEEAMGRLLNTILTAPAEERRDWAFLLAAAAGAGIADGAMADWIAQCVEAPVAQSCVPAAGAR